MRWSNQKEEDDWYDNDYDDDDEKGCFLKSNLNKSSQVYDYEYDYFHNTGCYDNDYDDDDDEECFLKPNLNKSSQECKLVCLIKGELALVLASSLSDDDDDDPDDDDDESSSSL